MASQLHGAVFPMPGPEIGDGGGDQEADMPAVVQGTGERDIRITVRAGSPTTRRMRPSGPVAAADAAISHGVVEELAED